ncbi:MAG TPA: FtsX-like permease family protein [Solirubrobacteraceae bacterium]|nr:FtsX-like permease family protein [Solirubrobacteraceae bacterium]
MRSAGRELALGARLAVTGGREGLARTLLVALGVALGVGVLLVAAAVPSAISAGDRRDAARAPAPAAPGFSRETAVRVGYAGTEFRGEHITGLILEPLGRRPALPPGVARIPAAGEMLVSPALGELLREPSSALLRERLARRSAGTLPRDALHGPRDLVFLASGDAGDQPMTADRFGIDYARPPLNPLFLLVLVVGVVVLLMPIAAYVGAAARIGGEARDRRLAAVRLVGADRGMARRIAAGEVLAGAVAGVALGGAGFLLGRPLVERVELWDISMFAADLQPPVALVALIVVAVPALAVLTALVALRGVVIEPLGVTRRATPGRRRVLWRLALPAASLALLLPLLGTIEDGEGAIPEYQLAAGLVLLLSGTVVLLPWLVEALVRRLGGGGGVSWQLAVRRMQLESGANARVVAGLVVAVAGAIALQSVFAAVDRATAGTALPEARAAAAVSLPPGASGRELDARLAAAPGTRMLATVHQAGLIGRPGKSDVSVALAVGDCRSLREFGRIGACRDGDAFVAAGGDAGVRSLVRPGRTVRVDGERRVRWRVPAAIRPVPLRAAPDGLPLPGVLLTPAAAGEAVVGATWSNRYLAFDPRVPDAVEHARNAVAAIDPTLPLGTIGGDTTPSELRTIRAWLLAGAVLVLVVIAAGLLIGSVEHLRERRRLLAALVAVGVRRRTLGGALFVQTAVPVVLGLALAVGVGVLLAVLLLRIASEPVVLDVWMIALLAGAAAAVVVLVTALSVPVLLRSMRPTGLRTE